MSALDDFADALAALPPVLRLAAIDPADAVRLLESLAGSAGDGPSALYARRLAVAELASAAADYQPTSYDEAVALRDRVCRLLDREIEFLPDEEALDARRAKNRGLTSPELAVLLAYTKIVLKPEMAKPRTETATPALATA